MVNLSRLISHSHLSSISAVRNPLGTSHRGSLLQHSIDLLEGKALSFRDQKVGVNEADRAEGTPEEEDLCSEIDSTAGGRGDVWGDDGDDLGMDVSLGLIEDFVWVHLRSSTTSWKRWRDQHHGI